jgi:bifunctional DNA-binding transcriptional regulator/antitoxin component of YhaV-PrlF toxin-antitoxin module
MKINAKGRVTIPARIRKQAGFRFHTEIEFTIAGDRLIMEKVTRAKKRASRLIKHMRGRATTRMTTDEIMALTRA